MAKNRNKGFSLIEVIIGVAVLTILLTPVVKQLAQTMRTNRLAKEQQYANESAANVLEYAQKTSFNDLKTTGTTGDVYVKSVTTKDRECDIYIYDSATNSIKEFGEYAQTAFKVKYSISTYQMNDVTLGSRRTEYTRTLLLDDLSNKIASLEYVDKANPTKKNALRILYDQNGDAHISDELQEAGFARTTEGSIVRYATDDDGTYISGIVCVVNDHNNIIDDPNTSKLGTMINLDSTQVALVNADSTNFDKQAYEDLYVAALAYLKDIGSPLYDDFLKGGNDPLAQGDFLNNLSKSTTITIDKTKDGDKPYYLVKVDVKYHVASGAFEQTLEYNVYSNKFYYDSKTDSEGNATDWAPTVPAVYIEYQPFSYTVYDKDSNTYSDEYALEEYLYVDNRVDGAKIYLYKPMKDKGYMDTNANTGVDSGTVVEKNPDGESYQVDYKDSLSKKVEIYVNTLSSEATKGKKTYIYTNLVDKKDVDGKKESSVDLTNESNKGQFSTGKIPDASAVYSTDKYDKFGLINPSDSEVSNPDNKDKTKLFIQDLYKDSSSDERLYTATVIISPKTENVNEVRLTGAKGGQ